MITRKHVFEKVVEPKKVEESNDNKFIWVAIYKAIYMAIKLLLDVRTNQAKIMRKMGLLSDNKKEEKVDNPVIKSSDNIK